MIVWGTKIRNTKLGRVADFCPFCRDLSIFQLHKHAQVGHVYFVGVGSGTLVGHAIICESCDVKLAANGLRYAAVSKDRRADLNKLIAETNPKLPKEFEQRLEEERRIREGLIDNDQRLALIKEPILIMGDAVEARAGTVHIDKLSGFWLLGTLFAFIAGVAISEKLPKPKSDDFGTVVCLLATAALLFNLVLIATDVGRYTKRKVLPQLVRALTPLNPTLEELTAALNHAKSLGLKIGRKVKPRTLYETIQAARSHVSQMVSLRQ